LVSRTKSPERRQRDSVPPPEKWKGKEPVKSRPAEPKQKEVPVEVSSSRFGSSSITGNPV
jgi:hypothetical protein